MTVTKMETTSSAAIFLLRCELIPKRFRVVQQAVCEGLLADHPSLESSLRLLMSQQTSSGGFKDAAVSVDSGKTSTTSSTSILTLLGYRHCTRRKGENKGPLVAAHTDVGVITLLLFDGGRRTCAKLQRRCGRGCDDEDS